MAGADFTYQTSEIFDEKNLLIGVWGLLNDRDDLEGDKTAVGFKIDYPNDLWAFNLTSVRIGDGFDPSLGFVPRNDIHIWDFGVEYSPRPSWSLVRQMVHEFTFSIFNNLANTEWESYTVEVKPFEWLLESGDLFSATISPQGDRPPEPFEVSDETVRPAGS